MRSFQSEAGKSFAQISMSLAYNDQPAMNRAFKRWFGMTPSQWRKTQSKNT
jgi:AraC-like DNA-binding protein